jgi:hypothetical protein
MSKGPRFVGIDRDGKALKKKCEKIGYKYGLDGGKLNSMLGIK